MTLDDRWQSVAVLGAGGKMGSGISFLLAREMTLQKLNPESAGRTYRLYLIDVNPEALEGLQQYLKKQAGKFAQKQSDRLREIYRKRGSELSEDALITQFTRDLMGLLRPTTRLEDAADAHMVFEAIIENIEIKARVFQQLREQCPETTVFFSNTSSIPIKLLNQKAGLEGRLIGFHFYNPPAVQKLVEIIIPEPVRPELPELAYALGRRLGKKLIPSNDVAGFIGNGHFMRDGLHAMQEVQRLQGEFHFVQAVYIMNRVSQDFLIRPMGIFQLIDYVGLDVFQSILNIMNPYFPEEQLHSGLIDELVARGIRGGQYPDGRQKDGFLKYEDGKPGAIYNPETGKYLAFAEGNWKSEADARLGALPRTWAPWKALLKDPDRDSRLSQYFQQLKQMNTLGAQLTLRYLRRSKEIGEKLVADGVAQSAEDVNGVLMHGFYHLYGPINHFV